MFSLHISNNGNKLDVVYGGHFDLSQAEQFYAQAQEIVPGLKKGFIVVTDFSSLEQMDISACPFIENVMDVLNGRGVSMVVRIIPDREKDIGFNIMSLFHYSSEVAMHTFKSRAEAEEYLNKKS